MRQVRASRIAFATMLVAVGLWGLAERAFVAIWAPGVRAGPLRLPIIVACSGISIISGLGIASRRYSLPAARLLFALLCIWLVWCKGVPLVHAPAEIALWESFAETAVVASAAWALAAGPRPERIRAGGRTAVAEVGPRTLYGLALIAFGAAHIAYAAPTANLVPQWLPWHLAWVCLTAATYIAAGFALVGGRLDQPAATLSAIQMAAFGILVWLPRIASGASDAGTLNEAAISFVLAASGWVIASSLRHKRRGHSTAGCKAESLTELSRNEQRH